MYRYIKKLLNKNSAAILAYKKAYAYARQSELKRFLYTQMQERISFRSNLLNALQSSETPERQHPSEFSEIEEIIQAVDEHNSPHLISACIHEETTECDSCEEVMENVPQNNETLKVVENHKKEVQKAISELHTMEELAVYRNSEARAHVLLNATNNQSNLTDK
jgi:hypothetical protein